MGLTGIVHFDNEGFRRDFVLDILELSLGGLLKIGTWFPNNGLTLNRPQKLEIGLVSEDGNINLANKTFTVITCLVIFEN